MSDLVGTPEDPFSQDTAHAIVMKLFLLYPSCNQQKFTKYLNIFKRCKEIIYNINIMHVCSIYGGKPINQRTNGPVNAHLRSAVYTNVIENSPSTCIGAGEALGPLFFQNNQYTVHTSFSLQMTF